MTVLYFILVFYILSFIVCFLVGGKFNQREKYEDFPLILCFIPFFNLFFSVVMALEILAEVINDKSDRSKILQWFKGK
jgi:hypothetical protein